MTPGGVVLALVFAIPAAIGIRATRRLWKIWRFNAETRGQLILFAFFGISLVITSAAIALGTVTILALLGVVISAWARYGVLILLGTVLLVPAVLERVVENIGRKPPAA